MQQYGQFCCRTVCKVNSNRFRISIGNAINNLMNWSLFSSQGQRKYLTRSQRSAFLAAASSLEIEMGAFCLTLALTGARISEALQLTWARVDFSNQALVLETLKRRKKGIYRAIPVPVELLCCLQKLKSSRLACGPPDERIWGFSRTTGWRAVKECMLQAGVPEWLAKPRALRHSFGVQAVQERISLNLLKKWLGHAKIETTAIYAEPLGQEERELARALWS